MEKTVKATPSAAPQPSIPQPALWDAAELQGRECHACACYFESVNPENAKQVQGFCRRSPAELQQVRGQEPRMDARTGQPVLRDGQPVMQPALITGYLFKAQPRNGTCWDGWRPKGTLPGESFGERSIRLLKPIIEQLLEGQHVPSEVRDAINLIFDITQRGPVPVMNPTQAVALALGNGTGETGNDRPAGPKHRA